MDERREEKDKRAAYALAATFAEGEEREELMAKAAATRGSAKNAKSKEEENLSKWAENPMSSLLREVNPNSILKNIFHLDRSSNATAKVYFTLLAL